MAPLLTGATKRFRLAQPGIQIFLNEPVIQEMGIIARHPIDLFTLPRRKIFIRIETPSAFEQSLAPQDLVQASDAAMELMRGIEQGGIRVSHLLRESQQRNGNCVAARVGGLRRRCT